MKKLSSELVLQAYKAGIFPMSPSADSLRIQWYDPPMRGILPLEDFYVPKRLRKTIRKGSFTVTVNRDFPAVMRACAQKTPARPQTWINAEILETYIVLHKEGWAHSIEAWRGDELAGGLYGIALGGAFFGESMFSRVTDASKVALVHLAARLRWRGFTLLDTQFINDHLLQFGAIEIPRALYRQRLKAALGEKAEFCGDYSPSDFSSSGFGVAAAGAASTGGLLSAGGTAASAGVGEAGLVAAFLQSMTQTS